MLASMLLGLCVVATVVAAPHPFADYLTDGKIMVLNEEGKNEFIEIDVYLEHLTANNISLTRPEVDTEFLNFTAEVDVGLDKRDDSCDSNLVIRIDTTQHFVDWDVQMSNVACPTLEPQDIFVLQGYTVTNTLQVSGDISEPILSAKLGVSFGVNFSRSWATQTSQQNKGTVPAGYCGVMITKPLTTRRYGTVLQGCLGGLRAVGAFMADDRGTGSYNGISWISGAVSMCDKKQSDPPLSRCEGVGNFV